MQHNLISAAEFCDHHHIEYSFITSLEESGLIEITKVEETSFIPIDTLSAIEKYVRLHYDLDINLQGIEAIIHMLNKMVSMQQEILELKSRLRLYE